MNGSFRLAHFYTHPMSIMSAMQPRNYVSSMYSDDVRYAAKELADVYRGSSIVPEQVTTILFLRDINESLDVVDTGRLHDEMVLLEQRRVTRRDSVSAQEVIERLNNPPPNTQWATIHNWRDAILTCLGFVWEPSV